MLFLWGFYKLLLEREQWHNFKRGYLLASILISFMIPLCTITYYVEAEPILNSSLTNAPVVHDFSEPINDALIEEETLINQVNEPKATINWYLYVLIGCYVIGVFILTFRFFRNLLGLFYTVKKGHKVKKASHTIVLVDKLTVPFTFLNYVFVERQKYQEGQIPEAVLCHELAHAHQKHSIDILLIEALQIVFWFNPILILLKKAIKLNHEFLADQNVLDTNISTHTYFNLLVQYPSNVHQQQLASPLNYSLTKKRLQMMTKTFSKKRAILKSLGTLPLLVICIALFNNELVAQQKQKESTTTELTVKESNGHKIVIQVMGTKIKVNDQSTTLENFAKVIDDETKKWKNSDLANTQLDIQLNDVDDSFLEKLNAAYRKTRLYTSNPKGHDLVPPSPEPPMQSELPNPPVAPAPPVVLDNDEVYVDQKEIEKEIEAVMAAEEAIAEEATVMIADVDEEVIVADEFEAEQIREETRRRLQEKKEMLKERARVIKELVHEREGLLEMSRLEQRTAQEIAREAREIAQEVARNAKEATREAARNANESARIGAEQARIQAQVARELASESVRINAEQARIQAQVARELAREQMLHDREIAKEIRKRYRYKAVPKPLHHSSEHFVAKVASEGGEIYYKGKQISLEKAMEIIRNSNKHLKIKSTTKNGKTKVSIKN